MEQVTNVVEDLKRQRCEYVQMIKSGNVFAQPNLDFIDNMLSQPVPDYVLKKCTYDEKPVQASER